MFFAELTTVYSEKYRSRINRPIVCVQNAVHASYSRLYYSNHLSLKGYRLADRNNGLSTVCGIWLRKCGSTI